MLQAGGKLDGAIIYVTRTPCAACEKMIANSGIRSIVTRNRDEVKIIVRLV
jgi:deoxycytidylate deaminase